MSLKDRMKSGIERLKSAPSETVRFMRSGVGAIVLLVVGVGGAVVSVVSGWGAVWAFVSIELTVVIMLVLSLPCFDVVEIQYRKWMFSQWQTRKEAASKPGASPYVGPIYKSWRDMNGPSVGVRSKMNNRWYEQIF